jgi:membrane-associated phospholipid phosphatase
MTRVARQTKTRAFRRWSVPLLLVLFVALSLLALRGSMGGSEAAVFEWIYALPESLRWPALILTQFGSVWMVIGVVGLLFVVRRNPLLSLFVLRNSLLVYVITWLAKIVVDRPRPMILLSEVTSREIAVFGNGFPSLHVALATVVSLTLAPHIPRRFRRLVFIWIGLVAWSRVYLGVHAPLDVVGGFVLGLAVVLATRDMLWPKPAKRS